MKKLVQKIKDTLSIFYSNKGFTLLELLVVVLIIGILAGIALPQYNKAVEKTRLSEALLTVNALQKAIDIYVLTNGYTPNGYTNIYFSNPDTNALDIDTTSGFNCSENQCLNNFFAYSAGCSNTECFITFGRLIQNGGSWNGSQYEIYIHKNKDDETWEKTCEYQEEYGKGYICDYLESHGFENRGAC